MIQKLLLIIRLLFLKFSDLFFGKLFNPGLKLICLGMFFVISISRGQVSNYTFAQSTGTYTPLTGATNLTGSAGSWDDGVSGAISIGFPFYFNGTSYTNCYINYDGYLTFGSASNSGNRTPISSNTGYAGAISVFGLDILSGGSDITYKTNGTAPNRTFVVEWKSVKRNSGNTGDLSFQIILNESTNVVQVVYGACSTSSTNNGGAQVGLRGTSNSDYNNRNISNTGNWASSTTGTSNTSSCSNNNVRMPSSGLTFAWTPTVCTFSNFGTVTQITNVKFNTLDNTSTGTTAYENFTGLTPANIVYKDQSYSLNVKGNTGGNVNYYYTAFFDWNQDGDFTDSGEYFVVGTFRDSPTNNVVASVYIKIPTTATLGNVRMRVIGHLGSYNTTPCAASDGNNAGQVEDYIISVNDQCSGAPTPGGTNSTANPVCSTTPFTLSLANQTLGAPTYQWQSSPDGAAWSNVVPSQPAFFSSDFSTPLGFNSSSGVISVSGSDAQITGGPTGVLILTEASGSGHNSAFFIDQSIGSNINAFTTSFDYRIWGGDGADGLSLSYGTGFANNNGGGENGEGNELILKLDSYDNDQVSTGARIRINYGGNALFATAIGAVPLRNASYRNITMSVDNNGYLSLSLAGTPIVTNLLLPGYTAANKSNWKFKFSARIGGSNDQHSIDNLVIKYLDVSGNNATYTTSQTAPTYYRALVTCGSNTTASTATLISMSSAVVNQINATTCSNTGFTVAPNGTNGTVPSGTTYTWPAPVVTGSMAGGAGSSGAPLSITGTLINNTGVDQTATYTVTPTSSGCVGVPFKVVVTVNSVPAPTVSTITGVNCTGAGSVILTNLPTGNWTINRTGTGSPASYSNTVPNTTNYTVTGLAVGGYYFTVNNGTCTSAQTAIVNINDETTATWNGTSWTGGPPTATKNVIINSVSTQPFTADTEVCSLTINSTGSVIIPTGVTLKVNNALTTNNKLIFENNSSLMQNTNAVNTGNITYKRIAPKIRQADFVYWSTPVSPQTLFNVSQLTMSDKFFYNNAPGWIAINSSSVMEIGKGYIIRGPETYSNTVKNDYEAWFIGVPNNGDYSTPSLTVARYHLIGNPYPSALSVDKLIDGNTVLNGAVYLWTHNTSVNPVGNYNYNPSDYAAYNRLGSVGTVASTGNASNPSEKPTGFIGAGQAFFVSTKLAGPVNFTNSMREAGTNNSQFFKSSGTSKEAAVEKDRVWLNLISGEGAFKQLLVGYTEGASNGYENRYDAVTMDGNPYMDFYSMINANKFTIQGRALPFVDTDTVPLGYRTSVAGTFTISIDEVDGKMSNQAIFIEDKVTGTIQDLRYSNYTFTSAIGAFTDRLVLRYTGKTLGTGDFENVEDGILISVKNKVINVLSSKENIKEVTVYDVTGKLLYNKKKVGTTELQIQNLPSSNQVLLVKVTLANDFTTTRKVIFQ